MQKVKLEFSQTGLWLYWFKWKIIYYFFLPWEERMPKNRVSRLGYLLCIDCKL